MVNTASTNSPAIAISGTIEATRLPPMYRGGLMVVAAAMLLLPLIYLALIGLAGSAVWWHATTNTGLLDGGGSQFRLLIYLTPLVAGVVLVFFMIKPIMARPSRRHDPLPIEPEAEPALFAFIEQICRQVRAPIPRRVQVDCRVNASAGFMPGRFGVFRKDLVLTVGLPLAAGLSVREFGGVLAHEFGHFAQGGGMRLTAVVRSINGWFGRVVYERDEWDERLERWSKESDWRLSIVLSIAKLAVWLSRQALKGLMTAGHAISCFMMRQMEYDADSYEIKLAGSDSFVRTMTRLRELSLGARFGYDDLREAWQTGALPSHLPEFLVDRCSRIPDDVRNQVRHIAPERTGTFDTHPSDADRVAAARAAALAGVLIVDEVSSTRLFHDFAGLSAAATRHHYEHDLGLSIEVLRLVDTDAAVRESHSRADARQALHTFFEERFTPYRALRLDLGAVEGLDRMQLWSELCQARDAMGAMAISVTYRQFDSLARRRHLAFAAQELLAVGVNTVDAGEFDLAQGTSEEAAATESWALDQQQALVPALEAFERAAVQRLSCGVCLLRYRTDGESQGADRESAHGAEAASDEAMSLVRTINATADALRGFYDLRQLLLAANTLMHHQSASSDPLPFERRLEQMGSSVRPVLRGIRDALKGVPCRPSFTREPVDAAEWCGLLPEPASANPHEVSDRLVQLYLGALGRLASVVQQEEARLDSAVTPARTS